MYEHRRERLLAPSAFRARLASHALLSGGIIAGALAIGVFGYHLTERLPWLDALLNASMILGGMGPVDPVRTVGGKFFASLYALFAGLVLIGAAGILLAPILHRLLHKLHLDEPS
jgi:hypothetical protein